jgi:hypothetical protein
LLYNSQGWFKVQFGAGNFTLFVRIVDDMGGVTIFNIPQRITVNMDKAVVANLVSSMLSKDASNSIVTSLQGGSIQQTTQYAIALGNTLNNIATTTISSSNSSNSSSSSSNSSGQVSLDDRVSVRSMLTNYLVDLPLSDVSSVKLVSSSLSSITNAIRENSLASAVCYYIHFSRLYESLT